MDKQSLIARFRDRFNMFCFFHLGSDAEIKVEEQHQGLEIAVRHHRVEPFQFDVLYEQLEELLSDRNKLERFLLDQLTPHRR